jgi:hypothetical protein
MRVRDGRETEVPMAGSDSGEERRTRRTPGETRNYFKELGARHRNGLFEIGDAINEAIRQHGDKAHAWFPDFGLADNTLLQAARVAERWPVASRFPELGYTFHRDAGLDLDIARPILRATLKNGWTRDQMREALRSLKESVGKGVASKSRISRLAHMTLQSSRNPEKQPSESKSETSSISEEAKRS